MFRKEPQRKALANLKSSERRKLLQTILEKFKLPQNMEKEYELKVLPAVVKQTGIITFRGAKGSLYTDEKGNPIWFSAPVELSNHRLVFELIPTILTLWRSPFLLPIVKTHPHVIDVLVGGANLMIPGSVPPYDERLVPDTIVAITDTDSPFLIKAVGICIVDLPKIGLPYGKTGVAVNILHTVNDELFGLIKPKLQPPEELDLEIKLKEMEIEGKPKLEGEAEEETQEKDETEEKPEKKELEEDSDPDGVLTTEDIDNFFKRSLMQTLTQTKLELPLPSSKFMDFINSNLITSHASIQIKKTSWKKSAKFLKSMEKAKFIGLKGKDNDLTVITISNVNNNEELKNFVPYKVKKPSSQIQQPTQSKNANSLILTNYYKANSSIRPIFNELDLDFVNKFYTKPEIKDILNDYISKKNLVNEKNKKMILINEDLSKMTKEASLGRDKLLPLFLKNFTEYYKISKPNETNKELPIRGTLPQVEIITETKIGRKLITRISNIEYFNIDIESFANELKIKCSGSTVVKPKVSNPKITEISVQGPHFKIVNELLTNKHGLNPNWISFTDKSKPKKKRPIV